MLWEGWGPCFSETPLSLSPALCSPNTWVHICLPAPQSLPGVLLWFGWFIQAPLGSVTPTSEVLCEDSKRKKSSGFQAVPSTILPLTKDWTPQTSGSPRAKSPHSAQPSSLNPMDIPFLLCHVHVNTAVFLPGCPTKRQVNLGMGPFCVSPAGTSDHSCGNQE